MVPNVSNYNAGGSTQMYANQNGSISGQVNDMFMTLFTAQIKYQDPFEPMKSSEYVQQLSQMAMMESNDNLVRLGQTNQILLDNIQVLTTTGLSGKDVEVRTNTFKPDGEGEYEGSFDLTASSSKVSLEIKDESGNVVETIALGPQSSGRVDFTIDAEKYGLDGEYTVNVVLDEGQNYTPVMRFHGTVDAVVIPNDGGPMLVDVKGVGILPYYELSRVS